MQILFAKNRDPYLLETHLPKIFDQSIQNSFNLYLFQLYLVQHICKQAKNVADKIIAERAGKLKGMDDE